MRLPRAAWILIGLSGFCALSGGLFYATVWRDVDAAASGYDRAREEADKVGAWMSPEEMRRLSQVPPEEDAASLYAQAKAQVGEMRPLVELAQSFRVGDPTEPLEAGFARHQEALETLDRALARPRADWRIEWEQGLDVKLPHLAELRDWGRIQGARAVLAAEQGRGQDALRHLRAAGRIPDHLVDSQVLIGYLSGSTATAVLLIHYLDVAAALPNDGALQTAIRDDLAALERRKSRLLGSMRGEGVVLRAGMARIAAGGSLSDGSTEDAATIRKVPVLLRANETRMIERSTAYVSALVPAEGDPIAEHRAIKDRERLWSDLSGLSHVYARILFPVMAQASSADVARIARCRAALTVLDMLDAKRQTGSWPKRPPVERIDPFSDKPLLWSVDGDTVKVWSVGYDGDDDKGDRGDYRMEYPRARRFR